MFPKDLSSASWKGTKHRPRKNFPKKRKSSETGNARACKRIEEYTNRDKPTVQKEMARRTNVSHLIVSRIIVKVVDRKIAKMNKVKRLSEAMIEKRKHRAKPFAKMVEGTKAEFILTLDEAMLQLNDMNGEPAYYYMPKRILKEAQIRLLQLRRNSSLAKWSLLLASLGEDKLPSCHSGEI